MLKAPIRVCKLAMKYPAGANVEHVVEAEKFLKFKFDLQKSYFSEDNCIDKIF